MRDLLQRNLANGFADFPGLSLSGRIPVKEELINQLIAEFLQKQSDPKQPSSASASDMSGILRMVKKAAIHADAGVVTLELELRADSKP